ncbi:MAG: DUF86 domain-containing protein [Nanoarchaeota archaeon]|nr:DUF86 domain-containing protein [Nanoarchaeota archaeon]MBU1501323.1 DUF86 domain-containing protein [Nanoarchaeota archaeon]MBU2459434.1 DUF86 domain-containing protein [Nanoarchaeota archaeon]
MKKVIDRNKILSKLDEIGLYLDELEEIKPADFEEYRKSIVKKRSCERLLQISVESVIDICNVIVANLRLGVPYDEDVLFEKLIDKDIISKKTGMILRKMKGFRNILVHKYGEVDNEKVFEHLGELNDFEVFKNEILKFLNNSSRGCN